MKYKSVIAFGDSHVAGCELTQGTQIADYLSGKTTLEEMDAVNKTLSFPNYVANQLGVPCYNYAISGGSNERSLRLLTTALVRHPDSLVLLGYTAQNRREFYFDDPGKFLGRDADNYIQVGVQWYNTGTADLAKKHGVTHPINDIFVEDMLRWKQGDHTSILNAMYYVQQACKRNSADLVHVFLFRDLYDKAHTVNALLDTNNILNFNTNDNDGYGQYQQWAQNCGYEKLPVGHYGQAAHDHLGKLIMDHLCQQNT